jgi:pantoate--beta-alanine ligase
MGALHDGHRSLFKVARAENDVLVASLFVNPAQFDRPDDLAGYPSDDQRDLEIAEEEGVDVLFAPTADEMYPAGFGTWVDLDDTGAEGTSRPGHFRGVATVCVKLFNIVQARRAYFGQKDAQQAAIVRRVVRDLNLDMDWRCRPATCSCRQTSAHKHSSSPAHSQQAPKRTHKAATQSPPPAVPSTA